MAEWNWEKNDGLGLNPEILTLGSGKKVWWKCSKGHKWQARIADRNKGRGCPYCSGRKKK
ncbi:MAG: zinc-ribbon domain-containing protein [Clostridia bacterium]|nr:zinc-ribbon domain-containing protein [Clostridia bacterium]